MEFQRTKEIASASSMVNVTYNGTPIYIEGVNENDNTANIHFLKNPKNSRQVSLSSLVEH